MAKTVLNLKLFYKNKLLDVAKYERDFTDKLYIGTDKTLFWQILDSKLPDRHLFLRKKDELFLLDLLPGMDVSCKQNDEVFNKEALQAKKLISGNELTLNSDMVGSIQLAPNWAVSYEFMEPWVKVLTAEEKQIISQYARRAELLPFDKFSRNFLIAATIITIIGLILFDIFKPKVATDITLEQRWEQMQSMATKVEVQKEEEPAPEQKEEGGPQQQVVEQTAPTSNQEVTGEASSSGRMSKAAAKSALAGLLGSEGFNPAGTGTAMNVAVTTEEDIVAASMGGGSGGGKGPGKGGANAASGKGAGFGSVFDPTAVSSGTGNLAGLSSGRPKGNLSAKAPGGDVTTYVGDVGRLQPVGKPATKVSSGVISRFSGPEVKKVAEGGISSAPAESRPELQRVEQRVARYKPQIKDMFNRYSQVKSMYGSLKFTLYIDAGGTVAGVQITPLSGEFYPEFMTQLEQLIRGWKFDNKNLVPYEFIMTFSK